jgi:MFS family permease
MLLSASTALAAVTIVIPGLQQLGLGLGATQAELQCITDVTPVVLAGLLLGAGALLDRFGRRRVMIIGLCVLAASMVWSALADSAAVLVAARACTGLGAALVFPGTLSTLMSVTPTERRPPVIGMWAGATMTGGLWSLLLASVIVQSGLPRGSFFLAAAVVVVLCLLGVVTVVPETRDAEPPALDPAGTLLSLLAVGGLTLGITELPADGMGSVLVIGGFATGLVATVAFLLWELRATQPMLDPRLFLRGGFTGGTITIILLFFGAYGWYFLALQYGGYALGLDPILDALLLVPMSTTIPCAIIGARLAERIGWRPVLVSSLLLVGVASLLMALVARERSALLMCVSFAVFGLGLGAGQSAPTNAIVDSLPASRQGIASAVNDTAREFGAALGIAVLGSLFNAGYRTSVGHDGIGLAAPVIKALRDSPAAGAAAAGPGGAARLHGLIASATVNGWKIAFLFAAGLFAIAAVGLLLLRDRRPEPALLPSPS